MAIMMNISTKRIRSYSPTVILAKAVVTVK